MAEWSTVTIIQSSKERLAHRIAILELLYRRRSFLLSTLIAGAVLSTAVAFLIPQKYQSTARIMPPDDTAVSGLAGRLANMSGLAALAPQLGAKNNGAMFVAVLSSRTMGDRLADSFDLRKVYHVRLRTDARKDLAENTSVSEDRMSGVITITVSDRDPQRAAALAAAYVENLNSMVNQLSTSAARRERIFLESRLRDVRQEWEQAALQLGQFSSKNATLDMTTQARATVEAATALQGQLIAAQAQLEGLKQIYSDDNARVRSAQAQVDELQRKVAQLIGNEQASGDGSFGAIPSLRKLPLLGTTYADLYSKASVDQAVLKLLTQQYEMAKMEEAREIPTVKILDSPDVPERRSFPPRVMIIVGGTFAALLLGALWALIDSKWSQLGREDPRRMFVEQIAADFHDSKLRALYFSREPPNSVSHRGE